MKGTEPPPLTAVIIGAQKAGTTSLLRYLAEHPQISGQATVEIGFFVDDEEWLGGWRRASARYFYGARTNCLVAKSAAMYMTPVSFERLALHNPGCLLIYLLRDPVDRAFSSYRMERAKGGGIDEPFAHILSALGDESHPWYRAFVRWGEYANALKHVYEFFPASQVQVLMYEDLIRSPMSTCRDVFAFIGVDDSFAPQTSVAHNVHREPSSPAAARTWRWLRARDQPLKVLAKRVLPPRTFDHLAQTMADFVYRSDQPGQIDADVRERLADHYRPYNLELASMVNCDLSGWSGMREPDRMTFQQRGM